MAAIGWGKEGGDAWKRVKLRRIIRLAYEMKFLRVAVVGLGTRGATTRRGWRRDGEHVWYREVGGRREVGDRSEGATESGCRGRPGLAEMRIEGNVGAYTRKASEGAEGEERELVFPAVSIKRRGGHFVLECGTLFNTPVAL